MFNFLGDGVQFVVVVIQQDNVGVIVCVGQGCFMINFVVGFGDQDDVFFQ